MLKTMQTQAWYRFLSSVVALGTVLVVGPIAVLASIPVICFLAPVALIAMPFMLVAFFGQKNEVRPMQQPLRKLQPQHSH